MTRRPCLPCGDAEANYMCAPCSRAAKRDGLCPACFATLPRVTAPAGRVVRQHPVNACAVGYHDWFQRGRSWPYLVGWPDLIR